MSLLYNTLPLPESHPDNEVVDPLKSHRVWVPFNAVIQLADQMGVVLPAEEKDMSTYALHLKSLADAEKARSLHEQRVASHIPPSAVIDVHDSDTTWSAPQLKAIRAVTTPDSPLIIENGEMVGSGQRDDADTARDTINQIYSGIDFPLPDWSQN